MNASLALAGGAFALVTWLHWQSLRKASRPTRWLFFGLLGLGVWLWVLSASNPKAVRPAGMLLQWLEPFDPIE